MRKRQNQQIISIVILVAGGLLLIIAAVIILAQNNARKNTVQPSVASNQEATYDEIARVPLTDAKIALDTGSAVFVDVRGAEVYAAGHIPGAVSIPLTELETRLDELDPAQWIITYCT